MTVCLIPLLLLLVVVLVLLLLLLLLYLFFVLDNETLPYNDVLNIKIKMPAIQIQTLYY